MYQREATRVETPAMLLGTLTHVLCLEPDAFGHRYVLLPKIDRRTKDGKEQYASIQKTAAVKGLTIVDPDIYKHALSMARSINEHPQLRAAWSSGQPELSYFGQCEFGTMKCRPDMVIDDHWIDVKTARDATKEGFVRAAADGGFHRRAAYYLDIARQHGLNPRYWFAVVDKRPPYDVGVYELSRENVLLGDTQWRWAYGRLVAYNSADAPEGYSRGLRIIDLPDWAMV